MTTVHKPRITKACEDGRCETSDIHEIAKCSGMITNYLERAFVDVGPCEHECHQPDNSRTPAKNWVFTDLSQDILREDTEAAL